MSASMPLSTSARASASATAIARSMEPSQRGLPGSGGRCTMPIRRITAQKCSTRRVDSLRGRRYHDATISKPERSHPVGYQTLIFERSEERRVGKSVDLGGRRIIKKKKNKSKHEQLI